MITTNIYNMKVEPDTRNHKGCFVRDTDYKLVGIDQAGWALICQDNTTCHYVDPAYLIEVPALGLDD
jgi:hypothetical protein